MHASGRRLQNNLGIVYWNRIRGERGDNLERAIVLFEAALTVFTREAEPNLWAAGAEQPRHRLSQPRAGRPRRQPREGDRSTSRRR